MQIDPTPGDRSGMGYQGGSLGDFVGVAIGVPVQIPSTEDVVVSVTGGGTGTFVATVQIQGSFDGVAFVSLAALTAPGFVPSSGGGGLAGVLPPLQALRAECTAYTSGTIEVRFGGRTLTASNQLTAIS